MVSFAASRRRGLRRRRHQDRDPEGRMPLLEHLRELRTRLVKSLLALVLAATVGWVFYDGIIRLLTMPVCDLDVAGDCEKLKVIGVLGPFNLQVKVALLVGVIIASPVWLYQLWAFVTPGLHRNERRYTMAFLASGIPLFLAGTYVSYLTLPKATQLLLGFAPDEVGSLIPFDQWLDFVIRLILVFGLAFELPILVVMLNLVGVLPARRLIRSWRVAVFAIFVFSAVATPTGDPVTMSLLALPMCVLYGVSVGIAVVHDRRHRSPDDLDYESVGDDETSPLDARPSRLED